MSIKWSLFVFVLFCWNDYLVTNCESINGTNHGQHSNTSNSISWITTMRTFRSGLKDCLQNLNKDTFTCAKQSVLEIFDEAMSSDVISVWKGIKLIRPSLSPTTGKGFVRFNSPDKKSISEDGFFGHILDRIFGTFRSHLLQISINEIENGIDSKSANGTSTSISARHRRQRNNMMIAMVFGMTALGAFIVPMGFQFLSVVSGKALLLAKMALLLASINGLKKVASSGVHYGLYQVPEYHSFSGGYYDRGDVQQPRYQPRNIFLSNTT